MCIRDRCVNCYWDGSKSEYIKKQNQQEETDMPTTEWLNKYEAIKDKLTCKDDLEAVSYTHLDVYKRQRKEL